MDSQEEQRPKVSSLKHFFEQEVAKQSSPIKAPIQLETSRSTTGVKANGSPLGMGSKQVSFSKGPPPQKPTKPLSLQQDARPKTHQNSIRDSIAESPNHSTITSSQSPTNSLKENPFAGSPAVSPLKTVTQSRPSNPFDDTNGGTTGSPKPPPLASRPVIVKSNLLEPPNINNESGKMERKSSQEEMHRLAILKELKESEEAFLSDMRLLVQIYLIPARKKANLFSQQDIKILFANAETVVETSEAFLKDVANGLDQDMIGRVFHQHMKTLQATYGEYCKNHDDAIEKVAEYSKQDAPERIREFLADGQSKLQGKTGAWDLSSLIIKPVQRVLKYPLLVKQLLKCTLNSHPDYQSLETAFTALEDVAERINDLKKRKDLVDKYTEQKGVGNVMHGITKRLTRGTQQLKLATGLAEEATKDAFYEALFAKFDGQYKAWLSLEKTLLGWTKAVKEFLESQEAIARSFEEAYHAGLDDPSTPRPSQLEMIRRYRQTCFQLSGGPWKEADFQIKAAIRPLIVTILGSYNDPLILVKKRDAKRLDFERVNGLKAKGDQIDKALQESADTYVSLHEQLVEELPLFISIMNDCMEILLAKIVSIQAGVYDVIRKAFSRLDIDRGDGEIIASFSKFYEIGGPLEIASRELTVAHKWRSDVFGVHGDGIPGQSSTSSPPKPLRSKVSTARPTSALIDFSDSGDGCVASLTGTLEPMNDALPRKDSKSSSTSNIRHAPSYTSKLQQSAPVSHSISTLIETSFEAVVIYPFRAETDDELSLDLGQIIIVLKTIGRGDTMDDESWWFGEHTRSGNSGWFPSSYVQKRS